MVLSGTHSPYYHTNEAWLLISMHSCLAALDLAWAVLAEYAHRNSCLSPSLVFHVIVTLLFLPIPRCSLVRLD
jgi:hypothetical protein